MRSRCGDGLVDAGAPEACDDGNTAAGDGCAADCSHVDRCVDGLDCAAYVASPAPDPLPGTCDDGGVAGALTGCTRGSGQQGLWAVDDDGLPAYDFAIDQRCDDRAHAYSPRPRALRDPIHGLGNGRGLMAMAHASGAVELYTQDRGHKWLNRVDTSRPTRWKRRLAR
jgi:cysteine-rich repeat protein